jgi:hypothetical protein
MEKLPTEGRESVTSASDRIATATGEGLQPSFKPPTPAVLETHANRALLRILAQSRLFIPFTDFPKHTQES